ncbi:MAG: BolA family protein [Rhizomicrobium sp.]
MREKLLNALAPVSLEIVDESADHAGHAGARPAGETHFHVRIVSSRFEGLTRLERQRAIHAVLSDELKSRVHALSIVALAPGDAGA